MIYLDNNSTTKVDDIVSDSVVKCMKETYGNSSCTHDFGLESNVLVEKSKYQIADLINCYSDEIVFTSGATESNNQVIYNYNSADANPSIILTSSIEHPSILKPLENNNLFIKCPVDSYGKLDLDYLKKYLNNYPSIKLVSIMLVNNETGIIQDLKEIKEVIGGRAILHSDITQAVGKINVDLKSLDIDLASISGHKFHAPKGVGVLYIKRGLNIFPFIRGGEQQNNMRSGTLNVPGIVGLGVASTICKSVFNTNIEKMHKLSKLLYYELYSLHKDIIFNSNIRDCVYNTVNFSIPNIDVKDLINYLSSNEIYVSGGSACSSGKVVPSYVIKSMGKSDEIASSTIRISMSKYTEEYEIMSTINNINEYFKIKQI